jgi:hypothetical protein
MTQKLNEIAPPGWGHTKADKPKGVKVGGSADAMKKAQKRGDIPKDMNIFALMWSMKNKGDNPHYEPGVKGKLKKKYKGPEGQNEMIDPKKIRNYKNVSNAVVAKADKEAEKVKDKEQKGTLEFPQMPTEESKWSKNFKDQGAKRRGETTRRQQAQQHSPGQRVPPKTKNYGEAYNSILDQQRARISGRPDTPKKQKLSITPAGKKALKKGDHKLSITPKGKAAVEDMSLAPKGKGRQAAKALYKENEVTPFGNKLRQAIAEAKKVNAIDTINKIVKTKTMGKLHGQKVDLFTASAIQSVYNALNKKNQQKMTSVMSKDVHGLLKMADFSMRQMKR